MLKKINYGKNCYHKIKNNLSFLIFYLYKIYIKINFIYFNFKDKKKKLKKKKYNKILPKIANPIKIGKIAINVNSQGSHNLTTK